MKFSKLSKLDKKELIKEIENMKFLYRDKLNFSTRIKFGIEIEYGNAKKSEIMDTLSNLTGEDLEYKTYHRWQYTFDYKIMIEEDNEYYGGEISSPIFRNKKQYFKQIKYVCEVLKKYGATINDKTGFHVHVSEDILKSRLKYLENFLKIYMLYEDIIFKFGFYGQNPRKVINTYSKPSSLKIYDILVNKTYSSYQELNRLLFPFSSKFYSITKGEYKPTFEFRNCNGTIDPIIIQNNINLFCNLLESSKNKNIDIEKIDYDFNKFKLTLYSSLSLPKDIDRALEFSDIIFKNDLDKKYFLKQFMMK